jgi:cytochrome c556
MFKHRRASVFAMSALVLAGGYALAQHSHHAAPPDAREEVVFPPMMKAHILSNMRDHLAAIQEIQAYMAKAEVNAAAKVAETRLGMSSLENHGAQHAAQFMPKGMQEIGTNMHRAASRFAVTVVDSAVTNDLRPALSALAEVTAQCVGCHASYKIK